MKRILFFATILLLIFTSDLVIAQCDTSIIYANTTSNAVCFDTTFSKVLNCYSNNYPDHTDSYSSPFTVAASEEQYSMCLYPDTSNVFTPLYETTETTVGCTYVYTFGVGINGVKYDPSSADYFVNTSDGSNNIDWHVEARYLFSGSFGNNGGHLNPFGEYHYHDVPLDYFTIDLGISSAAHSPIVGYAADGFPMYYKYVYSDPADNTSSIISLSSGYSLKSGTRPGDGVSAPNGAYSGLYYEDYEYAATTLDECNGRWGVTPEFPSGTSYYVLTDNYPYIPRCFKGTVVDNTFRVGPGASCPASTASTDCSAASAVVTGCMDPFSCNYNALATVDDGSCDYSYTYETETVSVNGNYRSSWGTIYNSTGTYYDTVIISGGCDSVYILDLTITGTCSGTITATEETTCGGGDGSITLDGPFTGTPGFQFSIDNGVSFTGGMGAITYSSLSAGTYYTVMSDDAGCTYYEDVILNQPFTVTYTATITDATCGNTDGTINIAAGGVGPFQYSIDGGSSFQGSSIFNALSAANYNIFVSDVGTGGCYVEGEEVVDDGSTLAIDDLVTQSPSCGDDNGEITITASGGTNPITYSIDSGSTYQSSNAFNSLASGSYNVVIKDASGCEIFYSSINSLSDLSSSPEITSWDLNTTGKTSSYWENTAVGLGATPVYQYFTTTDSADILSVCYNEDTVWITAEGMTNDMGQFSSPGAPLAQDYVLKFPRNPVAGSGLDEAPDVAAIGYLTNGVPMYGLSDAKSYDNGSNTNSSTGLGIWVGEAYFSEGGTLDTAFAAHVSFQDAYHTHATPFRLYEDPFIEHSPIVGYANDGFPVYGPFGYSSALDSTSGITRMVSSFQLRAISARTTLPDGSPSTPSGPNVTTGGSFDLGTYIQDYEYINGLGTLDEHNGRLCVTPEYPNGTYAYFVTVDAVGTPQFPYYIGTTYYGTPIADNELGNAIVPNSGLTCWDGEVDEANCNINLSISDIELSLTNKDNIKIVVEWSPSNNDDFTYFVVQKMINGKFVGMKKINQKLNSDNYVLELDFEKNNEIIKVTGVTAYNNQTSSDAIGITKSNDTNIKVYPTIFDDKISIVGNYEGKVNMTLINIMGETILSTDIGLSNQVENTINFESNITKGLYILTLKDLNGNVADSRYYPIKCVNVESD